MQTLLDFGPSDRTKWYVVNDGVMGGVSSSAMQMTDRGTGLFSGDLSLENNGGFASVRAMIGPIDLSASQGLELRVKGDGRTYQLRLRTSERYDGVAYRSFFETTAGQWTSVVLPFGGFQPTFRGRVLADQPQLDTSNIVQLAFMLADKQAGRFQLEVDHVVTWRPDGQDQ